jgi:hypothetical protein
MWSCRKIIFWLQLQYSGTMLIQVAWVAILLVFSLPLLCLVVMVLVLVLGLAQVFVIALQLAALTSWHEL